MDFTTLSGEALAEAVKGLDIDFSVLSNGDLTAAITERDTAIKALFALDPTAVTVEQVDATDALIASIEAAQTVQTERTTVAEEAAKRFAAARATFSADTAEADTDEADTSEDEADADEADADEADADEADTDEADTDEADADEGADALTAAARHAKSTRLPAKTAAKKVANRVRKPAVKASSPVVITAAADVPEFSNGQVLGSMDLVATAVVNRVKGFSPYNEAAAHAAFEQSGGQPVLSKFGAASFTLQFEDRHRANKVNDYAASRNAVKDYVEAVKASLVASASGKPDALSAAGWCAPSENVYSWIADYVVDGLDETPEISAPRGGLNITTGPARSSQGTALEDFGFTQTEVQAIAQTVKTCETIVCPDFVDHRMDAVGYCYKIPILTESAYPELVTDALRFADVLYAHKMNERSIADKVALATTVAFGGYGASLTDSLEAFELQAVRERRKWNIGENAIIEVRVPVWAKAVYRADMSRRTGLALTDVATDQKINAEFAARNLSVKYVSDWQELDEGINIVLPGSFKALMYPAGTFGKALKPVINLSAVYDAASLSINEYTGVFFEQGYMMVKLGYNASLLTIPVNTAGETGAAIMQGLGDAAAAGSF